VTDDPGHPWLVEGRRLHLRRRWAAAERAYREAIAAGRTDGWLFLGLLLQPFPGREPEAEAAFHAAMADESPAVAARAALELGFMRHRLGGDLVQARECFAFAAAHGSGRVWLTATIAGGHVLAAAGDRAGASAAFRSVAAKAFRHNAVEVGDDELRRLADGLTGFLLRPRLRGLLDRRNAARYRHRRAWRRLFPGGLRARR
jgi:hypothetical protein